MNYNAASLRTLRKGIAFFYTFVYNSTKRQLYTRSVTGEERGPLLKISIVIPMYNEEKIIEKTAEELLALCRTSLPEGTDDYEIVFSDDGSRDNCAGIVRRLAEKDPHIRLCGTPENHGKGSAIRHGVLAATGDVVLYTDCDLAYGTEQPANMLRAMQSAGTDLLIGSRAAGEDGYAGYTALRRLGSKGIHRIIRLGSGLSVSDTQTGLKCMRGDAAREIFSHCTTDGFAFDIEALMIAEKLHKTVSEFPVTVERSDRDLGRTSNVHVARDTVRLLRDIKKIRRRVRRLGKPS